MNRTGPALSCRCKQQWPKPARPPCRVADVNSKLCNEAVDALMDRRRIPNKINVNPIHQEVTVLHELMNPGSSGITQTAARK